jgi:hypothetical protein
MDKEQMEKVAILKVKDLDDNWSLLCRMHYYGCPICGSFYCDWAHRSAFVSEQ